MRVRQAGAGEQADARTANTGAQRKTLLGWPHQAGSFPLRAARTPPPASHSPGRRRSTALMHGASTHHPREALKRTDRVIPVSRWAIFQLRQTLYFLRDSADLKHRGCPCQGGGECREVLDLKNSSYVSPSPGRLTYTMNSM